MLPIRFPWPGRHLAVTQQARPICSCVLIGQLGAHGLLRLEAGFFRRSAKRLASLARGAQAASKRIACWQLLSHSLLPVTSSSRVNHRVLSSLASAKDAYAKRGCHKDKETEGQGTQFWSPSLVSFTASQVRVAQPLGLSWGEGEDLIQLWSVCCNQKLLAGPCQQSEESIRCPSIPGACSVWFSFSTILSQSARSDTTAATQEYVLEPPWPALT